MLAGTLQGRRLPAPGARRADRAGRVAVCEILRMTGRARDMILDPEQTDRLREVIAEGEYYGMQTFDQALLRQYQAGRVVDGGRAARRQRARTTSSCWSPAMAGRRPRWTTSRTRRA